MDQLISWVEALALPSAHADIDAAVVDALGWSNDVSDDALVEGMLDLNRERAS